MPKIKGLIQGVGVIGKKLVPPRFQPPQFPKREGKKPMTVLVGIIWHEGIILAADTQFTDPYTGVAAFGDKINVVKFKLGDEILVAEAGLPAITNRLVEINKGKATGMVIQNVTSVTKLAEDAVKDLKNQSDKKQWEYGVNGAESWNGA